MDGISQIEQFEVPRGFRRTFLTYSAKIQAQDAERQNRRLEREGIVKNAVEKT